jgi:hypothetical protein
MLEACTESRVARELAYRMEIPKNDPEEEEEDDSDAPIGFSCQETS